MPHPIRALLCALGLLLGSSQLHAADLTVNLSGLRSQQGQIRIAVVASPAQLDSTQPPVQAQTKPITGSAPSFVFRDLPPGRYAVMVNHDENANGKLDTNLIGMPVEGYGFSNNPRAMRKPTFDEAAFDLPAGGKRIGIELR
ncbi:DUF2141 domain-containing protein [Xanthomonas campestris pv. campestris]|nr:DUF2141 domain-containing protein [Xanthomonas campestris pv. campestris]